jgi:predicted transcriptional regulator
LSDAPILHKSTVIENEGASSSSRAPVLKETKDMDDKVDVIEMTAEIVAAYVENNTISTSDLPGLIQSVHRALSGISTGTETVEVAPKEPAVPVRRSITPDHLVCLEDGRKFKSLKRHLRTKYNMSPEDYRAKWGLAKDYPMVAPNYAKARSELAKQMGLGQGGRQAARGAKRGARS